MKRIARLIMICVILALLGGCAREQTATEPTPSAIPQIILPNGVRVDMTGATVGEDGTIVVPAGRTESGVNPQRTYYTNGDVLYVTYYDKDGTQVMPDDPAACLREHRRTNLNYNVGREILVSIEKFLVENDLSIFREIHSYDSQLRLRQTQICQLDEKGDQIYTSKEFDGNGNEIKLADCDSDWQPRTWTQWEYDDRNQRIKQTEYDDSGKVSTWTAWTYHATRRMASQKTYTADDVPVIECFYDELGRIQEKREYTNGVLSKEMLYQPDGSCQVRWYEPDGTVSKTENLLPAEVTE